MFTVRVGTVFEDSRLELRHWCYAFWRASTAAEGVAAREIMRQCRISYKSALFLMHRVRQAMAPAKAGEGGGRPIGRNETSRERDETSGGGRPGPAPARLKLTGFWQANIAATLQKRRSAGADPESRGHAAAERFGGARGEARRTGRANSLDRADLNA